MNRACGWLAGVVMLALVATCPADDLSGLLDEIDHATTAPLPAPIAGQAASAHGEDGVWPLIVFFAPTLVVTAATGVCGAVLGTFVVRRREALLAMTLPQAVAVGAAVGMRMGWPELPPALLSTLIALGLYVRETRPRIGRPHTPTLVPAMYVSALCVSFLVVAHGGQHVEELQNLFTGIDVAVTPGRARVVPPLLLGYALVAAVLWRRWLLLAQMPTAAELSGVSVARWQGGFLGLLAAYVLVATGAQGVVMVLAMLFLPVAIVGDAARRLPRTLAAAAAVSLVMTAVGFALSNAMAWPLSHSVGGVGFGLLALSRLAATRHSR